MQREVRALFLFGFAAILLFFWGGTVIVMQGLLVLLGSVSFIFFASVRVFESRGFLWERQFLGEADLPYLRKLCEVGRHTRGVVAIEPPRTIRAQRMLSMGTSRECRIGKSQCICCGKPLFLVSMISLDIGAKYPFWRLLSEHLYARYQKFQEDTTS